jgi:hypothetical protein
MIYNPPIPSTICYAFRNDQHIYQRISFREIAMTSDRFYSKWWHFIKFIPILVLVPEMSATKRPAIYRKLFYFVDGFGPAANPINSLPNEPRVFRAVVRSNFQVSIQWSAGRLRY